MSAAVLDAALPSALLRSHGRLTWDRPRARGRDPEPSVLRTADVRPLAAPQCGRRHGGSAGVVQPARTDGPTAGGVDVSHRASAAAWHAELAGQTRLTVVSERALDDVRRCWLDTG